MSSQPELSTLRSTLAELQSFDLPSDYCNSNSNSNGDFDKENDLNSNTNGKRCSSDDAHASSPTKAKGFNNPQLLTRYKSARNTYIQQATIESFLRSLTTQQYNPTTDTLFSMPDMEDVRQHYEEITAQSNQMLQVVKDTVGTVDGGMMEVTNKWDQFVEKREELLEIVEGYERTERNRRLEEGDVIDEENGNEDIMNMGEEITEEDVTLQKEKLEEVQQRRLELENKLRAVKAQIVEVEDDVHSTKRVVNEVRVKDGCKPLDWRGLRNAGGNCGNMSQESNTSDTSTNSNSNGDHEQQNNAESISEGAATTTTQEGVVENEITQMESKSAELKQSSDFYDGMRELMEELGGVKIVSSKEINTNGGHDAEGEGSLFVLTLMLLGSHILEITLSKNSMQGEVNKETNKDGLHIQSAKLTTQTSFPVPESQTTNNGDNTTTTMNEQTITLMETMHSISHSNISFSKIMSQRPSVTIVIPPLDDLVLWSQSLESSSHGIRFILIETIGRLRTMQARTNELTCLRERYAAQIYDVERSSSGSTAAQYGGAEQEVVCAINEGITVALRLGADCPLVPGSVYISEIFGVGGWEESRLETLKRGVMEKRCRGPVDVMKCLVKEVRKRSKEDGWVVPATPSLPRGK